MLTPVPSFFFLSIEPNFNLLSSISHYLLPVQIGVGMCMEGIEHNPVVYELMSEMAFRSDPLHLEVNKYSYFTNQNKLSCILFAQETYHDTSFLQEKSELCSFFRLNPSHYCSSMHAMFSFE